MKQIAMAFLFLIFLFTTPASAAIYTIGDTWIDWPGYTSNISTTDENGTPKIDYMEVTLSDAGILENVDIVLHSDTKWREFNSLFINSYSITSNNTQWDDWDYLVHDGDGASDTVPGDGIWQVNTGGYAYTMTGTTSGWRHNSPNGIDKSSLFGTAFNTGGGWLQDTSNDLVYSYDFSNLDIDKQIDLSDGAFIAFAPYCANDVIGGAIPNPEPATMLLLGFGLIGLAGVSRKKFVK